MPDKGILQIAGLHSAEARGCRILVRLLDDSILAGGQWGSHGSPRLAGRISPAAATTRPSPA